MVGSSVVNQRSAAANGLEDRDHLRCPPLDRRVRHEDPLGQRDAGGAGECDVVVDQAREPVVAVRAVQFRRTDLPAVRAHQIVHGVAAAGGRLEQMHDSQIRQQPLRFPHRDGGRGGRRVRVDLGAGMQSQQQEEAADMVGEGRGR